MSDADLITQVTAVIEEYCGTTFTETTKTEDVTAHPDGTYLILPDFNIASVTSIVDRFDSDTTVASTNYDVDLSTGLVHIKNWGSSGTLSLWKGGTNRYRVVYVTGYDGSPADIQLAASMLCAEFRDRDDRGLSGERLGDYSYTVQDLIHGMSNEVRMILSKYVNKKVF